MDRRARYILWTAFGVLWLALGVAGILTGGQDETVAGMFITIGIIFLLSWLEDAGLLVLSSTDVILSSILVTTLSAKAFQWRFFRKGDVE